LIGFNRFESDKEEPIDIVHAQVLKNATSIIENIQRITDVMIKMGKFQEQFLKHLEDHANGQL